MLKKNEQGFTLIELLVVIAIIGILAAIAIPQFAKYRATAFCARVESDVKNTVILQEAVYAQTEAYDNTKKVESQDVDVNVALGTNPPSITTVTGAHPDCDKNGDGNANDVFTFTGAAGTYTWS